MLRTAGTDGTGRLDAIVYRAGGSDSFYVSEHECSFARGGDLYTCLDNLSNQVLHDVADGVYPLTKKQIVRTFVTTVEVPLDLRDGTRNHPFICRIDEIVDYRGRRLFESQCPTNYLRDCGSTMHESIKCLVDVISVRYAGESIADLMRELPKRPIMTTFNLSGKPGVHWANAAIIRKDGRYEAFALAAPVSVQGKTPPEAIERLEQRLANRGLNKAVAMSGEPVYCTLDVPLQLKENTSLRRFFVSVSLFNGRKSPFYTAYAPQAGISIRSPDFNGALDAVSIALAQEFREKSAEDVKRALKEMPILTAARIG